MTQLLIVAGKHPQASQTNHDAIFRRIRPATFTTWGQDEAGERSSGEAPPKRQDERGTCFRGWPHVLKENKIKFEYETTVIPYIKPETNHTYTIDFTLPNKLLEAKK